MAIIRPTTTAKEAPQAQKEDAFISMAPDAVKKTGVIKGKKQQISLTISPHLLQKVDELAAKLGQTRAGVINMAIYRMVESGVTIEP